MRDELIIEKIKESIKCLDEIDNLINTQSEELQKIDYEISDWLHYVENNDIDEKVSYKIMKRIKELRKIRRSLHNEHEIEVVYKNNSSKMMGNNTRPMLLAELNKTIKQLDNDYKNRILTDDEIENVIKTRKIGKLRKEEKDELLQDI